LKCGACLARNSTLAGWTSYLDASYKARIPAQLHKTHAHVCVLLAHPEEKNAQRRSSGLGHAGGWIEDAQLHNPHMVLLAYPEKKRKTAVFGPRS
jgi:hypothetical protein